jgi:6-phosphogluconolactonase
MTARAMLAAGIREREARNGACSMPIAVIVEPISILAERLVRLVERLHGPAVHERGRFACALPGGSVAASMFPRLARASVDWSRTDVFFADERAVPPGDIDSNYRVARSLLVDEVPIDATRVHRMPADDPDLSAAAGAYAAELERVLGSPPRLDLVLLGVGADGHVASLFAGRPALAVRDRWVVAVPDAPKPPPRRLSLTLAALAHARTLVIAAFGPEKATAIHDAVTNPESVLPVALALRGAGEAVLLLEPDAALLLNRNR